MSEEASLTRVQVREVLRRHRGSILEIAADLGITHVTISQWLKGKTTSRRVAEAATKKALDLLASEKKQAAA